ncbi:hypothetical protein HBI81_242680 [Parastagonospora nodorum]|nr:hypothetical protein HBI95_247460 [Parastagonospora nodorum]KAH5014084.1 hypothetical protein HBI74_183460 [Parastagonospora nodorum]KAH5016471.1 hypothetical protein HBI75_182960 [Parastagonospora nodorum]KAH5056564.1 hypothetical protein HBI73_219860 [Parastagonospora nodorum]KAH5113549.1 hypothetical protein HBH71_156390 [Parastagonospora nodorum]
MPVQDPTTSFMNIDHLTVDSPRLDADAEATGLLKETVLRPYQAYCVTEASSRPPSPSSLRPQPLRVRSSRLQNLGSEPQSLPSWPDLQTPATYTQRNGSLAILSKEGKEGNEQHELSNQALPSRCTSLESQDHITQAVTPRGSHPLATSQTRTYDETPSHSRMQQTSRKHVTASTAYRRKALPQHFSDSSMGHHPLPPLPIGRTHLPNLNCSASGRPETAEYQEENLYHKSHGTQSSIRSTEWHHSGEQPPVTEHRHEDLHLPTREEIQTRDLTYFSKAIIISPLELRTSHVGTLPNDVPAPSLYGRSRPSYACADQPQFESSERLYISRGLLSGMEDDRRAHRRTQPKDAQLKYQFGRRPDIRLDVPPPTPPHRSLPKSTPIKQTFKPTDPLRSNALLDQPLFFPYASPKTGPGPRPPPWGSSDNLELRRQTRSDAREREDARILRDSGSSFYKSSDSTESMRENTMRREVEEYREQVLRLYPDLEFDGKKNEEGGCCWCLCVVM